MDNEQGNSDQICYTYTPEEEEPMGCNWVIPVLFMIIVTVIFVFAFTVVILW